MVLSHCLACEVVSLGSCKTCFVPSLLPPLSKLIGIFLYSFDSPLPIKKYGLLGS